MAFNWQRLDDGTVQLEGELTRHTVLSFWQQRTQWLTDSNTATFDVARLDKVDSAGVALFLELLRAPAANTEQRELVLRHPSQQLKDIAAVSGVDGLLSLS